MSCRSYKIIFYSKYNSEDISIGTWLAPLNNVYRRHDPRFNTQARPRPFSSLHIVLHKITPLEMQNIWNKYLNKPTADFNIKNVGLFYNWDTSPSKCYTN